MNLSNEKGMTLLELIVAGIVFMLFLTSFTSVTVTHFRHLNYLLNRLSVAREARTARAFLLSDLSSVSTVALAGPSKLRLHYAGDIPRWTDYADNQGSLIRQDSSTNASIVAAQYVDSASFSIDSHQNASISISFRKGGAGALLNIVVNTPVHGEGRCWRD